MFIKTYGHFTLLSLGLAIVQGCVVAYSNSLWGLELMMLEEAPKQGFAGAYEYRY